MIVKRPNPILTLVCGEVKVSQVQPIAKRLRQEWRDFQSVHSDFTVVGLAAPQIGIAKRVFLAFGTIFINPKILGTIEETGKFHEGCCSLGDTDFRDVERSLEVEIMWLSQDHKLMRRTFYDASAAVILHEMDHLDGIMIDDRAPLPKVSQKNKAKVKA